MVDVSITIDDNAGPFDAWHRRKVTEHIASPHGLPRQSARCGWQECSLAEELEGQCGDGLPSGLLSLMRNFPAVHGRAVATSASAVRESIVFLRQTGYVEGISPVFSLHSPRPPALP